MSTTPSKSGLFEIQKIKIAKTSFDSTEIDIRIPKFQNFGLGLAERERQADEYENELASKQTPEEIAQVEAEVKNFTADMIKTMREGAATARNEKSSLPAGDKEKAMDLLAKMMEDVAGWMEDDSEDEAKDEPVPARKIPKPEEFEMFTVSLGEQMKWDAVAEARLDDFIRSWPQVRSELLKKAHSYYKKLYPELKRIFGNMSSFNFIMPKPVSAQDVEDLFSIGTIYLREDGAIGISGSCTWDDEHGFGAVIKNGKVTAFGHADEGFC